MPFSSAEKPRSSWAAISAGVTRAMSAALIPAMSCTVVDVVDSVLVVAVRVDALEPHADNPSAAAPNSAANNRRCFTRAPSGRTNDARLTTVQLYPPIPDDTTGVGMPVSFFDLY